MQISPNLIKPLFIGGLFKKTANGTLVRACTRKGALFAFLEGSQDQVYLKQIRVETVAMREKGLQITTDLSHA